MGDWIGWLIFGSVVWIAIVETIRLVIELKRRREWRKRQRQQGRVV